MRRGALLAACCAPQVLVALDFAVLTVTAPHIRDDLGVELRWLFSASSLAFGASLLVCGRLVDAVGARRMLLAGALTAAAAAAVASTASEATVLLLARAALGTGAACMVPAALALLTETWPEGRERNRALGVYGAAIAAGFVAGSLIGGALATVSTWRVVLALGAPPALATAALTAVAVAPPLRTGRVAVDPLTPALAATCVVLCALAAGGWAWLGVGALAAAALLAARERRASVPLLPAAVVARRTVVAGCAAGAVVTGTGVAASALLTSYLQDFRGFSPLEAGLLLAAFGSTAPAGARLARASAERRGARAPLELGLAVQGLALLAFAAVPDGAAVAVLLTAIAGFGLGHVVGNAGAAIAALSGAPRSREGLVGATLATAQYLGGAAGPAVLGGLGGFRVGFAAAGGLALAGTLIARLALR